MRELENSMLFPLSREKRHLYLCDNCSGEIYPGDKVLRIRANEIYCEGCMNDHLTYMKGFARCERCGDAILDEEDCLEIDGKYYCMDCAESMQEEAE